MRLASFMGHSWQAHGILCYTLAREVHLNKAMVLLLFLPVSCVLCAWPAGAKIALCICLSVGLCVPTYHMHNNYTTYIVVL